MKQPKAQGQCQKEAKGSPYQGRSWVPLALEARGKENYKPYTLILFFACMTVIHMVTFHQ